MGDVRLPSVHFVGFLHLNAFKYENCYLTWSCASFGFCLVSVHMSHIRIRNRCVTYAYNCTHT